jgi:hypothetical protein
LRAEYNYLAPEADRYFKVFIKMSTYHMI